MLISSEMLFSDVVRETSNLSKTNFDVAQRFTKDWLCFYAERNAHSFADEYIVSGHEKVFIAFDSFDTGMLHLVELSAANWRLSTNYDVAALTSSSTDENGTSDLCSHDVLPSYKNIDSELVTRLGSRVTLDRANELILASCQALLVANAQELYIEKTINLDYFDLATRRLVCFGSHLTSQHQALRLNNHNLSLDGIFNAAGIVALREGEVDLVYFWFNEQS